MARTSDTADYMVTQCKACGMLNVIPREYQDGRVCANCSGGPLMPVGYAILQERPTSRITVQIDVERDQLDRLIDDVAAVNDTVDGIIQKIGKIKTERSVYPRSKKMRFLAAGRRPVGGLDKSGKSRA